MPHRSWPAAAWTPDAGLQCDELPEQLRHMTVLRLMIQPLIENTFEHSTKSAANLVLSRGALLCMQNHILFMFPRIINGSLATLNVSYISGCNG